MAVGYGKEKFNAAQRACLNYGVFIRMAANLTEAVGELAQQNDYLLIAIFSDTSDYLPSLKLLRRTLQTTLWSYDSSARGGLQYPLAPEPTHRWGARQIRRE